jgi:hypothetical protein
MRTLWLTAFAATLAIVLAAPQARAAVVVIDDTFGDGDYTTNTDGTGTGFQIVSNGAGGTGSADETGGQVTITTNGANDSSGIVSNDTLPTASAYTVFWDIAGATNIAFNGIELLVQGGIGFRQADVLNLRLRSDGSWLVLAPTGDLADEIDSGTYTLSEALDGFAVTLAATAAGWSFDFTGLDSIGSISGTSFGTGGNFANIFHGARVAATVQQGSSATPAAMLTLNQITVNATIIPEPTAFTLLALGALTAFAHRRRDSQGRR